MEETHMHDRASCTVGKPLQINRTMIISWYTIRCWFNLPWITGCAVFLASNKGVTDFAYGQNLSSTLCPLWGSPLGSSLEPFDHFCRDTPEASRNSKRCTNRPPSALLHSSGAVFIVLAKHTGSLKHSGLLPEMNWSSIHLPIQCKENHQNKVAFQEQADCSGPCCC